MLIASQGCDQVVGGFYLRTICTC